MATSLPRARLARLTSTSLPRSRQFHSYERPGPFSSFPATRTEREILSAGLARVPELGFTPRALTQGARDAGYLDITATNLFPRGAFALVQFHLVEERRKLMEAVERERQTAAATPVAAGGKKMGVGAKVRELTLRRLMANEPIIHQWQEALAVMAQPSNVPTALGELHALSDDIWYLAGDVSVDFSWYTKRATLSSVYAATDLFMTTDHSSGFRETKAFLDRRLEDLRVVGGATSSAGQWLGFAASQGVNILRSKGMRI